VQLAPTLQGLSNDARREGDKYGTWIRSFSALDREKDEREEVT
jgi:hypothetical protein